MEPFPALMGVAEIRVRLGGISSQRVDTITHKPSFPAPVATLIMGRVWRRDDIEHWIKEHRNEADGV
jgi:predicted DNA-binding transcriptional regulator AlpA